MKYLQLFIGAFIVGLTGLIGCSSQKQENKEKQNASLIQNPSHFPTPNYHYDKNPLSAEGIALGKRLFFDPILSKDNTISCGSCHHPNQAYADAGKQFSQGIHQQLTKRNTPGLFNLRWHRDFFADGGVRHFELIPLAPLVNRQEMDGDLRDLISKLQNNETYRRQFHKVFQIDSIQSKHILYALAQFMGTLISANARYDQYILGKVDFTILEKKGLQLFTQKCSTCHSTKNQLFTDLSYRNIGLDSTPVDLGRYRITERDQDKGLFKVPSLRNVMLTEPYMHDGRFETIEEVLKHYNQGVKQSPTLDQHLQSSSRLGIAISPKDKQALVAFLHTLTDSSFIKTP